MVRRYYKSFSNPTSDEIKLNHDYGDKFFESCSRMIDFNIASSSNKTDYFISIFTKNHNKDIFFSSREEFYVGGRKIKEFLCDNWELMIAGSRYENTSETPDCKVNENGMTAYPIFHY